MALQKLIRAELRVDDLPAAVAFSEEVFGLRVVDRDGDAVFLTCGAGGGAPQLVLRDGGTGVASFTLAADEANDLERYAARLAEAAIPADVRHDAAPGQPAALRFTLPTGHVVEIEARPDGPLYPHPAEAGSAQRRGVGPVDIDHITLGFQDTASAQATVQVLKDVLDFGVSDVMLDGGGEWLGAWTRAGELHHDVGLLRCQPGATLHHLAWTVEGADHLKAAADALAAGEVPLETGPGRHGVGGNLYAYFWAPAGNRYELSAEMPRVAGGRREPLVREVTSFNAFSAWSAQRPASFGGGS